MSDRPKHRILVVDDDPSFLVLHASFVKALGYDVETASDGIEALEKLPLDIDFVLLDAKMPAMDGFEVARYPGNRRTGRAQCPLAISRCHPLQRESRLQW